MVALPLEILDQIIGHHKELEQFKPPDRYVRKPLPLKHSNTLLACHKVSKQFRACALRYICRTISIPLYGTPKRLRGLQEMIFEEVNPQFGSLASFAMGVDILTMLPQDMPPYNGPLRQKQLKVHGQAVLQMLNTAAERITIRKLSISGSERARFDWKFLPLPVRNALESLLQLSSVSSLHIKNVWHLLARVLAANAHLKSLSVGQCWRIQNLSSFAASLQELEEITMQDIEEFPEGFKLPSLRTANVQHYTKEEFHACWGVIKRSSKTLRKIIYNGIDLPPSFDIASFPILESLAYSPPCLLTSSSMSDGTRFFKASRPVPNLRVVTLSYNLYAFAGWNDSDFSLGGFDCAWKELDLAFANGHFTGLQKLYVNVKMPLSLWRPDDGAESWNPAEHARAHILDLFCESRKLSLPIEVDVNIPGYN